MRHTIQRLHFWTSDDVAPLVEACTVSPGRIAAEERERYVIDTEGDTLLNAFFELLHRFTSLGKLTSFSVKFKQIAVDAVVSLPNLKEIELGGCSVDKAVDVDCHLKAARLSFVYMSSLYPDDLVALQRWTSLIDRRTLAHLSLLFYRPLKAFLDADIAAFPNVQALVFLLSGHCAFSLPT
ncbi:hypothetical protein MSAN_01237800 [Mycena sanguinolenta]|uniref:Uncharacterized protein n=1 Tax=Mycena sanguinolenta TaxID=230812 RepID=A0A8H7D1W3_9AGAR|nr:hypothetical protein MSAN_01237800 [Mycena sanguinolenta]